MVDSDSLRHLVTLAAVAEHGSFAAAARALGVTRAAVSKRIADLEDGVGSRLVHRTTRSVSLTDVGAAVAERALRMRAEAAEALDVARQTAASPHGLLRVTAPTGLGQRLVAPAVASVARRHPKLSVELLLTDHTVDLIEDSIDLAIRGGRLKDSSLRAQKVGPLSLVVCGAPRYLATHGTPKAARELSDHRWLVFAPMGRPQKITLMGPDGRTTVRLDGQLAADDGEVIRSWTAAGLGLSLLPRFWVEKDIADGALRLVLPQHQVKGGAVYAVHPFTKLVPPKVRLLIDELRHTSAATLL